MAAIRSVLKMSQYSFAMKAGWLSRGAASNSVINMENWVTDAV